MSQNLFPPGGVDSLIVYGPMSHALADYLGKVPPEISMIRIYGKTPPPPREFTWDIDNVEDLPDCLAHLHSSRPKSRIAFIGAGFMNQNRWLIQETTESVNLQIETNVSNYVRMTQALLPHMVRSRFGRFVYLSSFRTQAATRGVSIYSASKAFGEAFFKSVGIEYGGFGVTSVSIRMGYFSGGLLSEVSPERLAALKRQTALRRLGTPQDVSLAISYALNSEFTNGGVMELDGGLSSL